MKLERLFEVRDSMLFKIGEAEPFTPKKRAVKWSDVEPEAESYSEEFLARLRDQLKNMEENGEFAAIVPEIDAPFDAPLFTAAMKHAARRIKDCASVIGFAVPSELQSDSDRAAYMEELSAKHKHYCFFSNDFVAENVARI